MSPYPTLLWISPIPALRGLSWILNGYTIAYAALFGIFLGRFVRALSTQCKLPRTGSGAFTAARQPACAAATGTEMLIIFSRRAGGRRGAHDADNRLGYCYPPSPLSAGAAPYGRWTAGRRSRGGARAAFIGGVLVTGEAGAGSSSSISRSGLIALVVGWRKLPRVPGHDRFAPRFRGGAIGDRRRGHPWVFAIVKVKGLGLVFSRHQCGPAAATIIFPRVVSFAQLPSVVRPFYRPGTCFRIRPFTGATLAIAPFSAAFGALFAVDRGCGIR